ncbi:hypothetical protein [Streptomyces cinereoruber]|uniref:hypothetical protein n=1 Tax=Streptomyces cinereoruber TaxID=67260 RepID=UPI00362B2B66
MGIESDQLVYDYLSRVGDLAQQRHLSASDRARLVSTLRNEIDRRRATHGEETPAAVRGILGALGTPDEVVDRAGAGALEGAGKPGEARGPVPGPRGGGPERGEPSRTGRTGKKAGTGRTEDAWADDRPGREGRAARDVRSAPDGRSASEGRSGGGRPDSDGRTGSGGRPGPTGRPGSGSRKGSGGRTESDDRKGRDGSALGRTGGPGRSGRPGIPAPRPGVSAPDRPLFHGGMDRGAFDGPEEPDWWRTEEAADGIPGFVGGVERPDLFRPPAPEEDEEEAEGGAPASGKRRLLARLLRPRKAAQVPEPGPAPEAEAPPRPRLGSPFVLLAALLLLGGAVFGSLLALAAGWLLAYASRRLTPGEVKGAVLVIPGLAAGSGTLWLWGRVQGRWGDPVAPGGEAMGAAVAETWPWVLRGAAIASALFLLWRSRKR